MSEFKNADQTDGTKALLLSRMHAVAPIPLATSGFHPCCSHRRGRLFVLDDSNSLSDFVGTDDFSDGYIWCQ